MTYKFSKKTLFLHPFAFLIALCFFLPLLLGGCTQNVEYFDYVSELRNNIFLAEHGDLQLRIYSVTKEYPYAADGVAHEQTARTEVYLLSPDGTKNYTFRLQNGGEEYGGELAYDNVKSEYFLSFTLDVSAEKELPCILTCGEEKISLTASSVLRNETLSPKDILSNVYTCAPEVFDSLTDKHGFAGEIHLRLLYEDAPYYYVGVIDRNGTIHCFLVNAANGKVLAQRKND